MIEDGREKNEKKSVIFFVPGFCRTYNHLVSLPYQMEGR
jgi:hypothetical protein